MNEINYSIIVSIFQAVAASASAYTAWLVYQFMKEQSANQRLLAQRQVLVSLWQYIAALNDINPAQPITPDVVKAANTLNLIAVSCESGIVDKLLIKRVFEDTYLELYDKIEQCGALPGMNNKDGKAVLRENLAAQKFYGELHREKTEHNAPKAIGEK